MIASILIILCLILLNGVFAMGELALISARRARLAILHGRGVKGADRALRLSEDPQRFLPTVQVGITLVSILEGTFGGVQIEAHLTPMIAQVAALRPFAAEISMVVVVLAITFTMLVLGELVPKQIALRSPEVIASRLALPLEGLAIVTRPAVWVLSHASTLVLRLFGIGAAKRQSVTEEELKALIAESAQAGVLEHGERDMIERLLRLADQPVRAIMTPRNEAYWIDRHADYETLVRKLRSTTYSRIVVCDGEVDNPVGVLMAKDMLDRLLEGLPVSVASSMRRPVSVPDTISALEMLERMRTIPLGLALVLDEYGSFEGIVTASDLFEAIVGEHDASAGSQSQREAVREDMALLDGSGSAEAMRDRLGLRDLPAAGTYHTVAGLMLALLRRVPSVGDKVVFDGWLFEVLDMENRRVTRIRASRQAVAEN
ncbi:hemolysin/magnesium/cobalt transporter CorC/HlyC [Ameyamaea chiangmaiensis NBRC 103196]|uniref:HlyC/CorC family transporter n=1 Tax=Ameyamaea chiangmaiensis TaxID=442969 RepID=A0A850PG03_9PROT|nr:hemolysin family protein [Ameyamaea chiangmaiensis]MBS4075764.1 HlyC/CorC family transporter [Ameyamaea chiangmaiensis]NVN41370.1 HlyC/CorC family transporter [Ameyamaea chiangmaiensis]GBQ70244.1 hemolysin/magnesium/cobalt transporter CorC/HlyC [Ameyamaea chiangmaiensis NBRC 103196]